MPLRHHGGRVLSYPRSARLPLAICVGASVFFASSGVADAALRVGVSLTPNAVGPAWPARLSYQVQMTAIDRDERFPLSFQVDGFGGDRGGEEGGSLAYTDENLTLTGGSLLGPGALQTGFVICSPTTPAHGLEVSSRSWDLLVPAGTTATATLNFVTASRTPWPDTRFGVTFTAGTRMNSGEPATLTEPIRVRSSGPQVLGRRAVHIRLSSFPRSGIPSADNPRIKRGSTIALRGTTTPQSPNSAVRLRIRGFRSGKEPRKFTRVVRTDTHGRFRVSRLRLAQAARYEISAEIKRPHRGLAPDYACPLGFVVK
jgi:hypothetical protein